MSKNLIIDGLDIPSKVVQTDAHGNLVATNNGGSFSMLTTGTAIGLPVGASIASSYVRGNGFGSLYGCTFVVGINVGATPLSSVGTIEIQIPSITGFNWDFYLVNGVCYKDSVSNPKSSDVVPIKVEAVDGDLLITIYANHVTETNEEVGFFGSFYAQSAE